MSSLAASRADGYYFPPDYDPAKHGSLNQYNGQHPLRERANKLDQGILVIRFEMPFNVWCEGCNHLIGKGVRFNAEKKQIGNYYSTKIWSFKMNAPCCGQKIEVQTDPKNTEYVVISGGRRKVETWTAESAETIELPEHEEQAFAPRVDDTIARLERGQSDKVKAKELNSRVLELYHDSKAKFKNDYDLNKQLRKQNREKRVQEKDLDKKRKSLGLSDDVRLLPETANDRMMASAVEFGGSKRFEKNWHQKRKAIKTQSIFAPSALTKVGKKWDELGQAWDQTWDSFSSKVRRNSSEESAKRPLEKISLHSSQDSATTDNPFFVEGQEAGPVKGPEVDGDDDPFNVSQNSVLSQKDEPEMTADGSLRKPSIVEGWPAEPVACKFESSADDLVCKRARLWKCPLRTISEDREMDCSAFAKERMGKDDRFEGPKLMKKLDKAKCRAQLCSQTGSRKNFALAQCQQKVKKMSLSEKIASALKRQ